MRQKAIHWIIEKTVNGFISVPGCDWIWFSGVYKYKASCNFRMPVGLRSICLPPCMIWPLIWMLHQKSFSSSHLDLALKPQHRFPFIIWTELYPLWPSLAADHHQSCTITFRDVLPYTEPPSFCNCLDDVFVASCTSGTPVGLNERTWRVMKLQTL